MFLFRKPRPAGMSPEEAVSGVQNGTVTLVDVREPTEISVTGIAAGAINIPLGQLRQYADPRSADLKPTLTSSRAIAVYCASGGRSQMAAEMLRELGYRDVHNIGGFGHWCRAGGSVQPA